MAAHCKMEWRDLAEILAFCALIKASAWLLEGKTHLKSNLEKDFAAAVYLFEAPLPSKVGQAIL
jgi:hypothetical protein